MSAIKAIFGWLGSKALLYAALVLAILASAVVAPWLASEWANAKTQVERIGRLESVKGQLEGQRKATEQRLSSAAAAAKRKGLDELDQAISQATQAKAAAEKLRRNDPARTKSLLTADANALLSDGQLELEIQYRDREIAGLRATRNQIAWRAYLARSPTDLEARLDRAIADASQKMAACEASAQAWAQVEDRWDPRALLHDHQQRKDRCSAATAAADAQHDAADALKRYSDIQRAYAQAREWTGSEVQSVTRDLEQQLDAERSWPQKLAHWAERVHLSIVLWQAAAALALAIALPFLIRLLCYFVLAPLVMRRPAIRLPSSNAPHVAIPPAARSTTSVGVRLADGEELLVRQDYLQTSSATGAKGTQWFVDWRHPLTSLASGLTFLTRIRGQGEVTTVSAVRDPFAEVTLMTLPDGARCVLQPRALAGVVQPLGQPLRITSHWRLLSLKAWLTLQLRYLVFHGPARLVLKGGRGIRVEPAERGRIFAQAQLVGFSTDLAYSVTRTETFWPYFFGREQLLKDHVAKGDGVLIAEEAPMAGRRSGEVPQGIEGMIDAGMKVFGI